mmetsp:Transcript_6043/g.15477  ORF Transcript_6043/g.15477 Transcript_6043/m.15477 type:complete len:216 (-) Transcript_6043:2368-3015(-)
MCLCLARRGGSLLLDEVLHRRASAHKVAVAVDVVHTARRRPELGRAEVRQREARLLTRVGVLPVVRGDDVHRVRRVLQHVVVSRVHAILHLLDLLADLDQRVAVPVQLSKVLRLGGLHHDRASHRPRHGRRVEAIVSQALGDVRLANACLRLDLAEVEDELVRAQAVLARVEHVVVAREALGHVVRVEDGNLRRLLEAGRAHHDAVHVRDGEDGG